MNGMQLLDLARSIARDRDRSLAHHAPAETATYVRPQTAGRARRRFLKS